jgi:hypothetical protein
MISENDLMLIMSRRLPRHEIDTSRYARAHMCLPDEGRIAVYSFEYEDTVVSVRANYRTACDAAVRAIRQECGDNIAVNYIRLLPSKFKHDDQAKVVRF